MNQLREAAAICKERPNQRNNGGEVFWKKASKSCTCIAHRQGEKCIISGSFFFLREEQGSFFVYQFKFTLDFGFE